MTGRELASTGALSRPRGVWALPGKTWAVLRITLASRLVYMGELLIRSLFLVLILFIFTQLWRATERSQDVTGLTGLSVAQLIWYLVFTQAITMSAPNATEQEVDREVRSGDVAYRLARPLPYPLYHLGAQLGERLLRFGLNLGVGVLIALLVVGPISLRPAAVLAALGTALLAFVADWIWMFAISLLSFWVEDTFGLHLLYRRAQMILGGLLLPLSAYPEWLGNIARALPFQYLLYHPARLFVGRDMAGLGSLLAAQAAIGGVGIVVLWLLYTRGLKRVTAQGG